MEKKDINGLWKKLLNDALHFYCDEKKLNELVKFEEALKSGDDFQMGNLVLKVSDNKKMSLDRNHFAEERKGSGTTVKQTSEIMFQYILSHYQQKRPHSLEITDDVKKDLDSAISEVKKELKQKKG